MKPASTSLTLLKPLSLLKQIASSSLLSSSASNQAEGGERYLEQFLQKLRVFCFGISAVMSIVFLKQLTHRPALLGSIAVPMKIHFSTSLKTFKERDGYSPLTTISAEDVPDLRGGGDVLGRIRIYFHVRYSSCCSGQEGRMLCNSGGGNRKKEEGAQETAHFASADLHKLRTRGA
ncbi:hypothetical protein PGTUg99_003487 [Puccinia graminis f. sp. tritici]|uniref:Uncharacterized protein n=1 Tax=Puccinia graminis f. sp. tritici TaxID=56615 RepID=A0A5B0RUI0_PUCGR|nr:hypothetical protein PGTUg99_003487 [Puccinia graminis f. sp. tritici]